MPITKIEIDDKSVWVTWWEESDVLIPENKAIFDTYIDEVEPEYVREKYSDTFILNLVEEKEKENAGQIN